MLKKKSEIYWGILFVLLIRIVTENKEIFFVISFLYFLLHITKNFKLYIPKIPGLKLYIVFILYGTVLGIYMYSVRDVFRDLYYVLPSLLWMFIGYHLSQTNESSDKSLYKTLYIYGAIVSVNSIVRFILLGELNFDAFRSIFGSQIYDIGFIFVLLFLEVFINEEIVFGKYIDKFLLVFMAFQIGLSFGRVAVLQPIIGLAIIFYFKIRCKENSPRTLRKLTKFLGVMGVVLVLMLTVLPEGIIGEFSDKVNMSLNEIDSSQSFSSVYDASNNWRAYEMQIASQQWSELGILGKIFGNGLGKGVYAEYVPMSWGNILLNNELPLLHNGFYTLLCKGGLFAVLSMALIFIGSAFKGYKVVMSSDEAEVTKSGIILCATSLAGIATTWVTRGPIQQGTFFGWAILIGWTSNYIRKYRKRVKEYDKL